MDSHPSNQDLTRLIGVHAHLDIDHCRHHIFHWSPAGLLVSSQSSRQALPQSEISIQLEMVTINSRRDHPCVAGFDYYTHFKICTKPMTYFPLLQ